MDHSISLKNSHKSLIQETDVEPTILPSSSPRRSSNSNNNNNNNVNSMKNQNIQIETPPKTRLAIGLSNSSGTSCHVGCILQLLHHGMPNIRNAIINLTKVYTSNYYVTLENKHPGKGIAFMIELGKLFQAMSNPNDITDETNQYETNPQWNEVTHVDENKNNEWNPQSINPTNFYQTFSNENGPIQSLDTHEMGDAVSALRMIIQHLFYIVEEAVDHHHHHHHVENNNDNMEESCDEIIFAWKVLKECLYQNLRGQMIKCLLGRQINDSEDDSSSNGSTDCANMKSCETKERISTQDFHAPILLPVKGHATIRSSLKQFTSPRLLKGYCWPSLDEAVSSSSSLSFKTTQTTKFDCHHLPHHLLFQLQRFQFNPKLFSVEKVLDEIEIPLLLNMKRFVSSPTSHSRKEKPTNLPTPTIHTHLPNTSSEDKPGFDSENIDKTLHSEHTSDSILYYELTGIVFHDGKTADDGHYLTLVKQQKSFYVSNNLKATSSEKDSNDSKDLDVRPEDDHLHELSSDDWLLCNDERILCISPPSSSSSLPCESSSKIIQNRNLPLPLSTWTCSYTNTRKDNNKESCDTTIIRDQISDFHACEMILLYTHCSSSFLGDNTILDEMTTDTDESSVSSSDSSDYDSSDSDLSTSLDDDSTSISSSSDDDDTCGDLDSQDDNE